MIAWKLTDWTTSWVQTASGLWDLTRSAREPAATTYAIPCSGSRKSIIVEASQSALIIIDMQSKTKSLLDKGYAKMSSDFFLHPGLSPKATAGRGVVNTTVNMIQGFRKAGMKVLWTNVGFSSWFWFLGPCWPEQWGLDNYDLLTIPPAFLDGFSNNHSSTSKYNMGNLWPSN